MPKPSRRAPRRKQIESLEERLAMSADPLGGLLGGSVSHHAIQEGDAVQVSQHTAAEQAPVLSQHGAFSGAIADAPALVTHGDLNQPIQHQQEIHQQEIEVEQQLGTPDFWLDPVSEQTDLVTDVDLGEIEKSLYSAHRATGLDDVRNDYGFKGGGQTVAVIDSGIAYDHYALGGGYGANYRVVGGYDFTEENDADPYDDGPEGSHGTHVAGIIGSSDSNDEGVAPEVDLVGLRVFNDYGAGYFSWVEDALQWVINNRTAFENPITAVNLSLGTNWNSDTVPSWAMLENEFATLEAAGVFISVSAGNSFTSYNEPGLSYPAASPYVVPVMSMDDSGVLSYFSQRSQTAIAAPGRWIRSTVPDYAGDNNGVTDDWAYFSGTSMAAPYVAGASVIIREAMEFVGMTNITQDTIYDHMLATADTIEDSATGLSYARLNVEAAIDALMPTDDYGSSQATAYNLGTVTGSVSTASVETQMQMQGVISTLNDGDYFTFTAGSTGTVTFSAGNTTHDFTASWQGFGGEGWTNTGGASYTMNVVAGQQYTVALSSTGGLGYYNLSVSAEATFSYTDWGSFAGQQTFSGLQAGAGSWYRITASDDGYLTVQGQFASGNASLNLYDASLNLITADAAGGRIDYYAQAGEELYLHVDGDAPSVDVTLTALVSTSGSAVTVGGTTAADAFTFAAGASQHTASVNGVAYTFAAATYSSFAFDGGGGQDTVRLDGTSAAEQATLSLGNATLTASAYSVQAEGFESVEVHGNGGADTATLNGTAGDDRLLAGATSARLYGSGYDHAIVGFSNVVANAGSGGHDEATLQDAAGDDTLYARPEYAYLSGDGFHNLASGFDRVYAFASNGGYDQATLQDSAGNDTFYGYDGYAYLLGDGYLNYAAGFNRVYAFANSGGVDQALLYDSAGDDRFYADPSYATFEGDTFYNYAGGFDYVYARAINGGSDSAVLADSAGNDRFYAHPEYAYLYGDNFTNYVAGFDRVDAQSTGGYDVASLFDSAGDDEFRSYAEYSYLSGSGYHNEAAGFQQVFAFATSGGADTAVIYDTAENDRFTADPNFAYMVSASMLRYAGGFDQVNSISTSGGYDVATLIDSAGDDRFYGRSTFSYLQGDGFLNYTSGYDIVYAFSNNGGYDEASLQDSAGDDIFYGYDTHAYLTGGGVINYTARFDKVYAFSINGGADTAFLYGSSANDTLASNANSATLSGSGFFNYAQGFGSVTANGGGGYDTATVTQSDAGDTAYGRDAQFTYTRADDALTAWDFDQVTVDEETSGDISSDVTSTDYAYELLGAV